MPHLSILHTLRESLKFIWCECGFVGRIIIGPVLIVTAVSFIDHVVAQKAARPVLNILMYMVLMFSWVRLAVCCHRFILLAEQPHSFLLAYRWQMRDTWFAFYGIAIYLFGWCFISMAFVGWSVLSPFLALLSRWLLVFLFCLGIVGIWLLFSYLIGRLSLILPVTAIDQRPAKDWKDWAWNRSEGNEWPLMFLLGINPSLGGILLDRITDIMIEYANQNSFYLGAPIYGLVWGLYFLAEVFQVAVLSYSLKTLSTRASAQRRGAGSAIQG